MKGSKTIDGEYKANVQDIFDNSFTRMTNKVRYEMVKRIKMGDYFGEHKKKHKLAQIQAPPTLNKSTFLPQTATLDDQKNFRRKKYIQV